MLRIILNAPRRRTSHTSTIQTSDTRDHNPPDDVQHTSTTHPLQPNKDNHIDNNDDSNHDDDHDENAEDQNYQDDDDDDDDDDDVDSTPPQPDTQAQVDDDSPLETWEQWIRRTTHEAERHFKKLGVDDWVTYQRRRKWRWAMRVSSDAEIKWTRRALEWDPTLHPELQATRRQARPRTRWTDDINFTVHLTTHSPEKTNLATQQQDGVPNTKKHNTLQSNKDYDDDNSNEIHESDDDSNNIHDRGATNGTGWMIAAANHAVWMQMESAFLHRHGPAS